MEHGWFWAFVFAVGMGLFVFDVVRNRRRPLPADQLERSQQRAAVLLAAGMTVVALFLFINGVSATLGRDWRTATVGLGGSVLVGIFAVRYWRRSQRG